MLLEVSVLLGGHALPEDLVRVADIARLLGVSEQRVDQLASKESFPAPVARYRKGRLWSREAVEAWVLEVEWWTRTRTPWRRRT